MNKNRFRIIFNQLRGLMMVVAENVKSLTATAESGKASSSASLLPSFTADISVCMRPIAFSMMCALGMVMVIPNPANISMVHAIVRLKVHNWVKTGESGLSTEKALLECGASKYKGKSITSLEHTDEIVKIEKCMLRDGFAYIGEYKEFDLCSLRTESSTCKPNASIPLRTSTTRIDSLYCIEHAYLMECEPQSFERRQATSHCKKYPEQDICHQSNLPLTWKKTIGDRPLLIMEC